VIEEAVQRATAAVCAEASRRARGEAADPRYDIQILMLVDLAEELAAEAEIVPPPLRDLDVPIRAKQEPPPVGAKWCVEHQRYDLCDTEAS
jgi:hypothetical protein